MILVLLASRVAATNAYISRNARVLLDMGNCVKT